MAKRAIGERLNPPKGWREGTQSELACPHRDLSVCPECAAANPEASECYGVHYWIPLSERTDPLYVAAEAIR